jgi:hypothetical protein
MAEIFIATAKLRLATLYHTRAAADGCKPPTQSDVSFIPNKPLVFI